MPKYLSRPGRFIARGINLDQVRITKGVARYTAATISVPTAKFPHG